MKLKEMERTGQEAKKVFTLLGAYYSHAGTDHLYMCVYVEGGM